MSLDDINKIKGLAETALPVELVSDDMAAAFASLLRSVANEPNKLSREGLADAAIEIAFTRTSAFDAALQQFENGLNISKENSR